LYLYSISLVHQINFLRVDSGTGFALQDIWWLLDLSILNSRE
jgi:hypothetical protein